MLLTKVAHQSANFQTSTNFSCNVWYQVSFLSNFASLKSVMRQNSFVLFHLNLYILWAKRAHQSSNSRLSTAHMKMYQIPYVMLQAMSQCHDT